MPFAGACHKIHSVPHLCLEKNHNRLALAEKIICNCESLLNRGKRVSFSHDNFPSESLPLGRKISETLDLFRSAVNLLSVPVCHCDQIVYFVVNCGCCSFPNLSLFAFSVPKQDENTISITVKFFAEGGTNCNGKTLSETSCGLIYPGQPLSDGRVTLKT